MSPADLIARESCEYELALLIREARRRQRRRQRHRTGAALTALGLGALLVLAATGALSPARHMAQGARPAAQAATGCPSAPARSVATGALDAVVLGRGPVRLALGNVYLRTRRRVVLGGTQARGWSAVEVIWVVRAHRGELTVRATRLQRRGPIAVQSSADGLRPGSAALTLSPNSSNTAAGGLRLYPGAIWVRSGGCYALRVSGRGLRESIVLNAQAR